MAPSPNLEVISSGKSSEESSKQPEQSNQERRRVPRLCLTGEMFRLSPTGKTFSVSDLSSEGMGVRVLDTEDFRSFPVSILVEGELNLRRDKYPVHARVKNIRGDIIGLEFEKVSPEVLSVLKQYLDPASLGQELRPIPSSEQGALWYHGPSGTDFLLWRSIDGQYRKMALYVQGTFVQWELERGITTGLCTTTDEKSEIRGLLRFETLMLKPDAAVDLGKTEVAKKVLLSSNLPQDLQKWCIRQLTSQ